MNREIVLTLTGHDRVGIVEEITNLLVKHGGNVETSRMARLGGEFAMLALISLKGKDMPALEAGFEKLRSEGFQVTFLQTEDDHTKKYAGWLPYQIEVLGADHEGIIYEIAHHLAQRGINIEDMETTTAPAPMSGTPLFTMNATVLVPPQLPFHAWSDTLEEIGDKLNVTVEVTMIK
ncbi:MAG TPA: ACT domain-containing protein [Anaerolineales bacterium]|nr:ACT domain-containing protein [Anaerolineales bacterium]